MNSYKELDLKRIAALSERARKLIYGKDCFDGSDYLGTDIDPDRELKGFYMLELVYKEIEPYLDEIKSDIEKNDYWRWNSYLESLNYAIKMYESEVKYVLEFERRLEKPVIRKGNTSLPKELDTYEAEDLFTKIQWCVKDGNLYKWTGTKALFGYFVDKTSDYLGLRPSNNRIPWDIYRRAFQIENTKTAEQAGNSYKNKGSSEPEGFLEIKKICR